MNEARPDPDQLLASVNAEEARARCGKIYSMLEAAHRVRAAGVDPVLGCICRAIVRAHGGDIAAQVRPGGGARLVFTLPVKEPSA